MALSAFCLDLFMTSYILCLISLSRHPDHLLSLKSCNFEKRVSLQTLERKLLPQKRNKLVMLKSDEPILANDDYLKEVKSI